MKNLRSSLEIEADFNQIELRVDQHPLLGWAVLFHLLAMGVFVPPIMADLTWVLVFTVPFFVFAVGFFFLGLFWTRPATFRIQAAQLVVEAWTGRLARHRVYRLPLEGLTLDYHASGAVNRRPVYRLRVLAAGREPIHVGALACTEADLDRLSAEIEAAVIQGQDRAGLGAAEVPSALQSLRNEAGSEQS